MPEMLRKHVRFCGTKDFMFLPEKRDIFSRVVSPSLTNNHNRKCNQKVKKKVMGSHDSGNVLTEEDDGKMKLFVWMIQEFLDQMVATINSTALLSFPVYAIFLNVLARGRHWLIERRHILVGLLSVF